MTRPDRSTAASAREEAAREPPAPGGAPEPSTPGGTAAEARERPVREAAAELRRTQEQFRLVVESVPVGIVIHREGRIVYANPAAGTIVGAEEAADLLDRSILEFVAPEERETARERIARAAGGDAVAPAEYRVLTLGDESRRVEASALPTPFQGEPAVLTLVRDVTEQRRAEEALRESEARYRSLFQESQDAVYVSDPEGRILDVNPAAVELFGYSREELLTLDAHRLYVDPAQREAWRREIEAEGSVENFELRLRRRDGTEIVCVETATVRRDGDGRVIGYQGIIRDVTERRRLEEELEHRALHDPLTELPNRALFWDRLEHALARSDRTGDRLAVLFVDLDGFKAVNDRLGHTAGDRVLLEVSDWLRESFREQDTVARIGGDEFTVLMLGIEHPHDAVDGAERLLDRLAAEPCGRDESVGEIGLTASVGIAVYEPDLRSTGRPLSVSRRADELVRRADTAMYRAKEEGGGRYLVEPASRAAPRRGGP